MTKKDKYLVALDVGSAKTCALIGEMDETGVKFVSMGGAESKGLRKGLIANIGATATSVRRAIEEAEGVAGVPVERVLVGVAGGHVRGVNSRGGITLGHRPRDINREDVRHAVDAARNITLPEDRVVLHVLPQEFLLDSQDNIRDPLGMVGQRLEVNVHLVTSSASAMQNLVIAVNQAGVEVADTVLEPLASAEACLTQDERELGCCLLDIGGGTTELVVFGNGMLRHAAAIPVGGDHFTNDLAVGLRTPIPEAEKIKREYGCVCADMITEDKGIEIASVGDRPPRTVFTRMLNEIVEPRAHELLSMVRDELQRGGFSALIPAGLVLSGGGAHLKGLVEMAERMFNLPVRLAKPRGLEGMPQELSQPEYATVVGLLLYGARARRQAPQKPATFVAKIKSMFAGA
ncbi:MAG: cell division protein FtsA [Acidobacteriia bacterium]|nr:cell division protein FtsA [Terriglobia bacterium]